MNRIITNLSLILYYSVAQYLPESRSKIGILLKANTIRYFLCRFIFKSIGENVTIERKAFFGNGIDVQIGNNSGLGINSIVPNNVHIGENVMMGPNCCILSRNHKFDSLELAMIHQGSTELKQTIIEDDVWIGTNVLMTPGRYISKGTVVAAGCVLCKDFPAFSIVGGNPSTLIRSRL